mgnify:CR=1 FL=1
MNRSRIFRIAEVAMWALVQRHTGRVGYKRGVKSEGLLAEPPFIDCSGWSRVLLQSAMEAENAASSQAIFQAEAISAIQFWSDRIILNIEHRTGILLQGPEITAQNLPRCAAIGIKQGSPEWAKNFPRSRGITHIVQVVRRPTDSAAFVSESLGRDEPKGIRLTPLDAWLESCEPSIQASDVWAVDPFAMAVR